MKAKQRHQLKENALAHSLQTASDSLATHGRTLLGVAGVVVLGGIVWAGVNMTSQRSEGAAETLLADAMVTLGAQVVPITSEGGTTLPAAASIGAVGAFPTVEAKLQAALPKFEAAATTYPDSDAGLAAQYHLASTLSMLGRHDDAVAAFDEVLSRAGEANVYGRMAQLGRADALAQAGRTDEALAAWQALAAGSLAEIPEDALLLELGRAQAAAGDSDAARQSFTRIVEEYPTSPYTLEAQNEIDSLG